MKVKKFGTGAFTFGEGMVHAAELGVKLKKWRAAADGVGPARVSVPKASPAGRADRRRGLVPKART